MTLRPRTRHRRSAVPGALAIVAVVAVSSLTGCSPSIEAQVDGSLEDAIERAQDSLWEYRDRIADDPETAIPELSFVSDYRDGVDESEGNASYTLLGLDAGDDRATLTLLASGSAVTGGGWWYTQRDAAVCVDLVFSTSEKSIVTEPATCPDIPQLAEYDEVVALGDLHPRLVVTQADYPPPVCQCYSGSTCDCPGG